MTAKSTNVLELCCLVIFDSGVFSGFWNEDDQDSVKTKDEASWYDCRADAVKEMMEIPRKIDVKIYHLVPCPDPEPTRERVFAADVPDFLKTAARNSQ